MTAKNSGSGSDGLGGNLSRFGCWNERTMSSREQELVAEMKK